MDAAVGNVGSNELWLSYRDFLKGIYPLEKDTCWICNTVQSIAGTFLAYRQPNGLGIDYNGYVAILDHIVADHLCPGTRDEVFGQERASAREREHKVWADTVKDSLKTPLDTSAVSLNDIGLGFLLSVPAQHGAVSQAIRTFYAVENPFEGEPAVRYSLEGSDVAQIEVFDVLGNRVWSSERGVVGAIEREIRIPLASSGKYYYARLSTGGGAVRTIRIVRK